MSKCRRFKATEVGFLVSCVNCIRWNGTRCKDEKIILYEETMEFEKYDRMMRENKGVQGPL
ncbi:hypothetical protein [Desulfosporosinus lacus]|uniref:Uncharacterized protein n=1 Tax=Desulfosporosinus lacus DSM 15449 TaxID=1121420 RepID=A0A1M5QK13_9FIRM|nr:hypothetical protein [Desulfosporosinus lacus]SHH14119.1 hypothetical protein SAMN02746098_00279 [Desulfosporosinus lacus DSM 15449]